MTNDLNNWLDNAPVIGSDLNDVFEFWLDNSPFSDIEAPTNNIGNVSVTLGNATLAGTARVQVGAALTATLDAATLSSTGSVPGTLNLTVTLGDATLSSTTGVRVTTDTSQTLADATLSSATTAIAGGTTNQTLEDATLVSAARAIIGCTVTVTLDDATLVSAGIVAPTIHGALDITLDAATLSSTLSLGELPFFLISDADLIQATRSGYFYYDYQMFDFDRETTAAVVSTSQELERLIAMVEGTPRLKGWILVPTSDWSSTRPARVSIYDLRKIRHIFNPVDTNPVFPQATT